MFEIRKVSIQKPMESLKWNFAWIICGWPTVNSDVAAIQSLGGSLTNISLLWTDSASKRGFYWIWKLRLFLGKFWLKSICNCWHGYMFFPINEMSQGRYLNNVSFWKKSASLSFSIPTINLTFCYNIAQCRIFHCPWHYICQAW